jgi:hypothetical protein
MRTGRSAAVSGGGGSVEEEAVVTAAVVKEEAGEVEEEEEVKEKEEGVADAEDPEVAGLDEGEWLEVMRRRGGEVMGCGGEHLI